MTITFKSTYQNSEGYSELNIQQVDNSISIETYSFRLCGEMIAHSGIFLDKKQLSEFIGVLLHIQSKIRK